MKNVTSAIAIVACVYGLWLLFEVVWFLAVLFMPVILVITALYVVGYYAPKGVQDTVQKTIRSGLDWVSFNPELRWAWPLVKRARKALDWLGIQVPG